LILVYHVGCKEHEYLVIEYETRCS
jgi:hypothetical protein